MKTHLESFITAAAFLAGWVALPSHAADINWRRPDGGTFSSASSWFSGVVPGAGDNAYFSLSTPGPLGELLPYTVSFSADATNNRLVVEDDSVVFDLNGHDYNATNASFPIVLGTQAGAAGQLTVADGDMVLPQFSDVEIASVGGSRGSLAVGADGFLRGGMNLLVGLNGAGGLLVSNGGRVSARDVKIGVNASSSGDATITGTGSRLNIRELSVGNAGPGTLEISGGASVLGDTLIGWNGTSGTVNVEGVNSQLIGIRVSLGRSGVGILNVVDGANVTCNVLTMGALTGDATTVVSGAGSALEPGELYIGVAGISPAFTSSGTGELRIQAGSEVLLREFEVTDPFGPPPHVFTNASTLLGDQGSLYLEGGTLRTKAVEFIGTVQSFFWSSGLLNTGRFDGSLTVPGGGVFDPVNSNTGTQILGAYDQHAAGSTLIVDMLGASPSEYDRVDIQGVAMLGGQLQVKRDSAFTPSLGDEFQILAASSVIGTFAVEDFTGAFLGRGLTWDVVYSPTAVTLKVVRAGDFDGDGDIDGRDFLVWQRGGSPMPYSADDLALWQSNYGTISMQMPIVAGVPEPTTKFLSMFAFFALVRRRLEKCNASA